MYIITENSTKNLAKILSLKRYTNLTQFKINNQIINTSQSNLLEFILIKNNILK